MVRSRRKLCVIDPGSIGGGQAIPYPYLIRCSPEPKVIGLQGHAALAGLVQKNRQPDGAWPAFAQAAQKKILRHAAFEHCIYQQNVSPLQLRVRTKQNFAPFMAIVIHVTNIRANEMANCRRADLPDQIGPENKAAIHGHNHVQPPAPKFA